MENQESQKELVKAVVKLSRYTVYMSLIAVACIVIVCLFNVGSSVAKPTIFTGSMIPSTEAASGTTLHSIPADAWKAPDENTIPTGRAGDAIRYGRELIAHTAQYFGPKGSVAMITNGMNCQNCHLAGGTKLFGNDYAGFPVACCNDIYTDSCS